LINPSDDRTSQVWTLLLTGLGYTLLAAVLAMSFSLIIGTGLAVSRITSARWYRWVVVGLVELFRGVPVVLTIFFVAAVFPEYGLNPGTLWYLVIGLTIYNSVIIAEVVRAGILALPRGQSEAAYSVGLSGRQVFTSVLLPQAFRAMLPALISQLVVILKDTSLGFIISYEDLTADGQSVELNLNNPLQTFFVVALIYIVINYGLSRLATFVEHRVSHGRKAAKDTADVEDPAMIAEESAMV
jgi:glutamate transport system permease protein